MLPLDVIKKYYPNLSDEDLKKIQVFVYLAKDVKLEDIIYHDEDEQLTVELLPFAQALEKVMTGKFKDIRTQIGLLLADKYLETRLS